MSFEFWRSFAAENADGLRPLLVTDPLFSRCNETKFRLISRADLDDGRPFLYLVSSVEIAFDGEGPGVCNINCQYSHCSRKFSSSQEADDHFNSCHAFACVECHKCFPSGHLLDLHVAENHDAFFALKANKEPAFRCLIPSCATLSPSAHDRLRHAERDHSYPPHFRFDPSCGSSPRKVKQSSNAESMDASSDKAEKSTRPHPSSSKGRDLRKAVPKHISFGPKRTPTFLHSPAFGAVSNGGKKKRGKKNTDIDMKDVSEALPDVGTQ